jgi:hypothetical protein
LSQAGVGREGKSSESVHDVDPEQLNGGENGPLSEGSGAYEGDNGGDVFLNLLKMRMFLLKPFALLVRSLASQVYMGAVVLMTPFVSSCNPRSLRKDLETRDGPDAFAWVESTEDRTLHDDTLCAGW